MQQYVDYVNNISSRYLPHQQQFKPRYRVFILCTSMENRTITRHLHCMVTRFMNREIPTFTQKIESIEEMNTTGREEEKRHA